jgi:serine/threonine-protein kinase ATR
MLKRSNDDGRNQWCSFFYACRTAVRSQAGMSLAEFILPLLVLDRMCYGNSNDERAVVQELLDVLDFGSGAQPGSWTSKVSQTERQKAVNAVFMILDTLQYWSERETEERYHHSRSTSATRPTRKLFEGEDDEAENTCWLWDESNSEIAGLLKAVPLSLQADAAAVVGMHARSLRLMEMAARAEVVQTVYDNEEVDLIDSKSGSKDMVECQKEIGTQLTKGLDIDLFKQVLGHLNDCETMEGIATTSDASSSAIDGIRVREAKGDWAGASYDYERALQLNESFGSRLELERGSLRCLLELGQFESVLHQVNGIVHEHRKLIASKAASDPRCKASKSDSHAVPFAVEAAWRLGRWSALAQILDDVNQEPQHERCLDPGGLYRVSLGNAMHGLHNRSESVVTASIRTARQALMSDLSNVARDSYSRSYSYLIRLHCLREVENACAIMCNQETLNDPMCLEEIASSCSHEGWNWDGRLNVVSVAECSAIIDVRLALARLAGDSKLEGSLFLTLGKKARKNGQVHVAANFLAQAEACCIRSRPALAASSTSTAYVNELLSSIRLQFAKLKHLNGENSAALRILGLENVTGLVETDDKSLQSFAIRHERNAIPGFVIEGRDQAADVNRFSRRLLQSTQWMVEGGIKGGSEVMDRFRMVQRLSPTWEKGKKCSGYIAL